MSTTPCCWPLEINLYRDTSTKTDSEPRMNTDHADCTDIGMYATKLKYPEITEKIIGCAMEVHNFLGNGFQEVIYQRALAIEFEAAGIQFEREKDQAIIYKGKDIGTRRVDFLVGNTIMVELKAISQLDDFHYA